jgi:hypothetical protein
MESALKNIVRRFIPAPIRRLRGKLAYLHLLETNPFIPAPGEVRRVCLLHAQRNLRYRNFVETGTHLGETAATAAGLFENVHTVELDPMLARRAKERFQDSANVTVHEGNSADVLPTLLPRLEGGTLLWLDAHYSGGATARGEEDTPLLQELESIRLYAVRPVAVLIDDARMLGTDPAYPSLPKVVQQLQRIDERLKIGVIADLVWAAPESFLRFEWWTSPEGEVEIPRQLPL